MPTDHKPPATVRIGGRDIPLLQAALIAQEADRRRIPPSKVGQVVIPNPAPTHVELDGCRVTILTGAMLAAEADKRQLLVKDVVKAIVAKHEDQRARKRRPRGGV